MGVGGAVGWLPVGSTAIALATDAPTAVRQVGHVCMLKVGPSVRPVHAGISQLVPVVHFDQLLVQLVPFNVVCVVLVIGRPLFTSKRGHKEHRMSLGYGALRGMTTS